MSNSIIMAIIRLQKHLADCGIASRRNSEKLIVEGLVKVNGKIITELGSKVDNEKDIVEYQNKVIKPQNKLVYILLNKPAGYVTSLKHEGKKTILDLVKVKERVFPVGRLDEYSEGLLIMTNDGDLAYRLTHPKFEHEKEYLAELFNSATAEQIKELSHGIVIEGQRTWPAKIKKISEHSFSITIHEGRNRQVRRMCLALGLKIKSLRRVRIGSLILGSLGAGKWRYLGEDEIRKLKERS